MIFIFVLSSKECTCVCDQSRFNFPKEILINKTHKFKSSLFDNTY